METYIFCDLSAKMCDMEGKKDVSRALFSFKAPLINFNIASDELTENLLPTLQLHSILLSFNLFSPTVIGLISSSSGGQKHNFKWKQLLLCYLLDVKPISWL